MDEPKEQVRHYIGLDLGPIGQFTGLAVLEKRGQENEFGSIDDARYSVRHLSRFPPGTPYSNLIDEARKVLAELPDKRVTLVVDQTAVGTAVFNLIRDALGEYSVHAVTVTAGHGAAADQHGGWLVSKLRLVAKLQILLQHRRLKIAPSLEQAPLLAQELTQFQIRSVPLNSESSLEWRERPHDDLVLAVAIAAWQAEQPSGFFVGVIEYAEVPEPPRWW